MKKPTLTAKQFALLADLTRTRGATREAAELVLVLGMRNCDAARLAKATPRSVWRIVKRLREVHAALLVAYRSPRRRRL
jgi:hypothetical protein